MAEVRFSPAADADHYAIIARHAASNPRSAAGFDAAVDEAIDFLSRLPEAYGYCDDRHRRTPLGNNPYSLIYRVDNGDVRVVAIPHDRQAPGSWAGRV